MSAPHLISREQAATQAAGAGPLTTAQAVEARLWTALQDVEDPEIPISVVGMGLIVSLAYRERERAADLELTFTAMGCPAMDFIEDDIRERLMAEADVDEVRIEVVWDPGLDPRPHPGGRARDDARPGDRRMTGDRSPTGSRDAVWEVFARQAYEEPLHHVGTVTEEDEDLALVSARSIYDEQNWIHMIIVPRAAIREAIKA